MKKISSLFSKFLLIVPIFFHTNHSFSQETVTTNQAIDQIEKTLLSSDNKEATSTSSNSGVKINKIQGKDKSAPEVEMVIVDPKNGNNVISEKQKMAYAAMQVNQYEVALELYKQILKAEPKNSYAKFGLAVSYHKLGQYRQADNLYSELLKTNPANKDEIIGNLLEVVVEESPNDSIYLLAKLSAQNPKSSYILARSAMAYDKINKSDQALMLLNRAVVMDPNNSEYKFNLAVIYDKMKDYRNALNFYGQVVSNYVESGDIDGRIPIVEVKNRIDFIKNMEVNTVDTDS
jgi:lipopolysaccharide assembly protein B